MKKLLSFVFIFVSLLCFSPIITNAEELNTSTEESLLATVNIQDATIISQKDNVFNLFFRISNREIVQRGIRYGVQLVGIDGESRYIADEKMFDESITLLENQRVEKLAQYVAPELLSGKYHLLLVSENKNGFPFAMSDVGEVELNPSNSGLLILPGSCSVKLGEQVYKKEDSLIFDNTDNVLLSCIVSNTSDKDIVGSPFIETRVKNSMGQLVKGFNFDKSPINFLASKEQEFQVSIPISSLSAGLYKTKVYLNLNKAVSNSVEFSYSISGISANIFNLNLDKENYQKGDIATVSVLPSISGVINNEDSNVTFTLFTELKNGKGLSCGVGDPFNIDIVSQLPKVQIPINVSRDCSGPQVEVMIKDSNGVVLTQEIFSFENGFESSYKFFASPIVSGIAFLIILVLIAIIYIVMKHKNKFKNSTTPPTAMMIFAFVVGAMIFFGGANISHADTWIFGSGNARGIATYNLDKSSYGVGSTVGITVNITPYQSGVTGYPTHRFTLTGNGTSSTTSYSNYSIDGSLNFTAPSTAGTYNVSLNVEESCNNYWGQRIYPLNYLCAAPAFTQTDNQIISDTQRLQTFAFGGTTTVPGDTYTLTVYSHSVSVVASSGDSTSTMAAKMRNAINSTTAAEWNSAGSWRSSYGLPTASTSGQLITIYLDKQHQFAGSAYYNGSPTINYYPRSIPYTVIPNPPTVNMYLNGDSNLKNLSLKESDAKNTGVSVYWDSSDADYCTCVYVDVNGNGNVCGSGIGQGIQAISNNLTTFKLEDTTTFTINCGTQN